MRSDQIVIIILFSIMLIQMIGFGLFLRIYKLSIGGIPPINPVLFKISKAAMMFSWLAIFLQACGFCDLKMLNRNSVVTMLAVTIFTIGSILQFVSYMYLGKSLKFGIPDQKDTMSLILKKEGIYRFSRNPMYVGFFFMMAGSSLYTLNPFIWILSLFAMCVHHAIVLKEEKYLEKRFGSDWKQYVSHVRRYI